MSFDVEKLRQYIPKGDGYNSDFANNLEEAATEIETLRAELNVISGENSPELFLKIITHIQGDVRLLHNSGYMVKLKEGRVSFCLDATSRAMVHKVEVNEETKCPILHLILESATDAYRPTVIEIAGFPGWKFCTATVGKTIAVTLTNTPA